MSHDWAFLDLGKGFGYFELGAQQGVEKGSEGSSYRVTCLRDIHPLFLDVYRLRAVIFHICGVC